MRNFVFSIFLHLDTTAVEFIKARFDLSHTLFCLMIIKLILMNNIIL